MTLNAHAGRGGGGHGASSDNASLLFGPNSESNSSVVIQIESEPVVIKAYNLVEGDEVRVEMVDGEGAGRMFAPFCPFDGQSTLTYRRNVLPIGIPGRYRFVLLRSDGGAPALGQVVVRCHPVAMPLDWLIAYLKCTG